jgi:hypothetical protein
MNHRLIAVDLSPFVERKYIVPRPVVELDADFLDAAEVASKVLP